MTVRAFNGSRRNVNREIDLLIDVGPCSFSITFQILKIPIAFSLLLGRPWIHAAGAVPSFLHQKLKFFVEGKLITVNDEEDYVIYKETPVLYVSIGEDQNLLFHSFDTISAIRDYGEVSPSRADCMLGKALLRSDYVPGIGLGAHAQGILHPVQVEEYRNRRGLGFRPSCHEIIQARHNKHLRRLAAHYGKLSKGISVPPLSHFFRGPPLVVGGTSDDTPTESEDSSSDTIEAPFVLLDIYAITEETFSRAPIRRAQENDELNNWTTVPCYSAIVVDVLQSNPNHGHNDSNPLETHIEKPLPTYFGERLDEDGHVPEIEESLHRLENYQLTSVEPTEEINIGTAEEPHTLRIGTGLDPAQRARMIDFLTEYQEVFAWSYADMLGLDPSIVKHFLPVDTERFPPKRQHLRRQRADLLLHIKEEVIKQWRRRMGKLGVCIDYRDLNRASPMDNFSLPHIDVLVDDTVRHTQFSFMDGFSGYNQIQMAAEDKVKTTFITMWGTFCYKIEVYVDNMIAKSKEGEDHLVNLTRLFERLKQYKLKLNLVKCTFGVKSGKLLGFVVSGERQRGQKDDSTHAKRAIYYLSKKFTEGESNYPEIEKMCCALVWVMQRLWQYTLYHTIRLLSKTDPLKYLLDSPSSMRNIAKWHCQLTEYDIEYVSRTSVKGQAITDHLAEFLIDDYTPINSDFPDEGILQVNDEEKTPGWKMYFDGAVNSTGFGIGAVLISPEGRHFSVAANIDFPCTNNIVEYEACIIGLQAAIDLKVKELEVFGDSMLTIF
ncbi:hypothetical protein CRG98_036006 [Punica granatum]|uniref:G-patch domain-containing protein n=1 Tax=Punica granatum TaxID=22663 RepID=A0A2I0IIK5_PUNGR|nr:hypothetical protein CRG98_036006 [Punica granatum]